MKITKGIKKEYRNRCQMASQCATCAYAIEARVNDDYCWGCSHPEVVKTAETVEVEM